MSELTNLERLTRLITKIVVRNMKLEGAMIFVYDYNNNSFRAEAAQGNMKEFVGAVLKKDDPIVRRFDQTSDAIMKEDIAHEMENKKLTEDFRLLLTVTLKEMNSFRAVLCVPSKIKDRLIGFLMLSEKKSQDAYNSEDLMLFQTLAPQAATAIKNAMTYDEIRKDLEKEHEKVESISRHLERSERLASLGTLVAGVAHEVRNPLQALRLKAEGMLEKASDPAYVREGAETIIKNTDRVLSITKEMLDLSKTKAVEKSQVDVNEMIDGVLKLLAIKEPVRLKTELSPVAKIEGSYNQLSQVIINLVQNAVKAMPRGGELTVRTYMSDKFVNIEVADTGIGIPKENLKKIFEPFFTTYAESTGLGLSITNRIVTEFGGHIKVKSEEGKGSAFTVAFPLSS